MKVTDLGLGTLLFRPEAGKEVFSDHRGTFCESFRSHPAIGEIRQGNTVGSWRGVIRGLHYQRHNPQGKLVRCVGGWVWDVGVDMRPQSPTFGQWRAAELTAKEGCSFWMPPGFAHGYLVLSDYAVLVYECTSIFDPETTCAVRWNDPDIGINWPLNLIAGDPILSDKDAKAPLLKCARRLAA